MSTTLSMGAAAARRLVTAVRRQCRRSAIGAAGALACAALLAVPGRSIALLSTATPVPFSQQGAKLVGSGNTGTPEQGDAVALSADGNTALVGGTQDNSAVGGAWVFTRGNGAWTQQGAELIGTGNTGSSYQGFSTALSADGNTATIGGPYDSNSTGAVWVFTRSGGTWSQQAMLIGGGESGAGMFGHSVALSADGNTLIVGGPNNDDFLGAAWVFTRSNGIWTQQSELIGTGFSGPPALGSSVALSADGNTAIIGGNADSDDAGAAWVFVRSSGTWNQQGSKLVGTGNTGAAEQGSSVALSADGNTALVGGPTDASGNGAAWVFTRSGGIWSQQGSKLFGSGAVNSPDPANQGFSAALSADGNTAMIGGPYDNGFIGAAWTFARTGGVWTQLGSKLSGSGYGGTPEQGWSAALSGDGNTALLGGPDDTEIGGAAWVFVRTVPTNTHDFSDDGVSDILWRDTGGDLALWLMSGGQFSSGASISAVPTNWSVVGSRDFDGDGGADILWLDNAGDLAVWLMNDAAFGSGINLGNVGTQWQIAGTGDFNGDGSGDILWRNMSSGDVAIWLMTNGQRSSGLDLGTIPLNWTVAGIGDFNNDGNADILWRNTSTGDLAIWFMSNGQVSSGVEVGTVPLTWTVVGTGDLDGDGVSDILWRDGAGDLAIWLMTYTNDSGITVAARMGSGAAFAGIPTTWSVAATGDFDGDGTSDILWIDGSGNVAVWLMSGRSVSAYVGLGNVGTSWTVQARNAD